MQEAKTTEQARRLRKNMTDTERVLWEQLKGKRFGRKFRRQAPIGHYIVDFVCFEQKVVIELDGGQHAQPEQKEYDAARTHFLQQRGFRVLRFWNNEVMTNLEGVLMVIDQTLSS